MATVSQVKTKDGISWHVERSGHGPDLVLIPSGEGDCHSLAATASELSASFSVTTFDMPGFSRSVAPTTEMENLTGSKLAKQVITLLDELDIKTATFYGCSSGGIVALTLASEYTDRVRSVVVHEVPTGRVSQVQQLVHLDDNAVRETCRTMFADTMVGDAKAWEGLGAEYHARLEKNFVTWVRTYVGKVEKRFSMQELGKRPVEWSVGALMPMGAFFENVVTATEAKIPISLLPSRHFPQVTIPKELAEHISQAAKKHS